MNTPTHLLIGAAILARPRGNTETHTPEPPWRNWEVVLGALAPDAALFVMFAWMRWVVGVSEETLWDEVYWRDGWQSLFAMGNSFPVYVTLLAIAWFNRSYLWGRVLSVFALAALLHLAFDLPFHHDDAHRHFWPVSDWRFRSPLSYWNPAHHGDVVGIVEAVLAIGLIVLLWRRFRGSRIVSVALAVALLTYVAVPAYFTLMLGS